MSIRVRRYCAAIAAGVLLAGVAVSPAHAEVTSLTGTVTELATGEPIAGACVSALNYDTGAEAVRSCTGADGTYALTVPAEASYKLRATADTYHELFHYRKTSTEAAAAVYLSPNWSSQPITFSLFHAAATVTGRITDAAGAPVYGADVRIVPEDSWDR